MKFPSASPERARNYLAPSNAAARPHRRLIELSPPLASASVCVFEFEFEFELRASKSDIRIQSNPIQSKVRVFRATQTTGSSRVSAGQLAELSRVEPNSVEFSRASDGSCLGASATGWPAASGALQPEPRRMRLDARYLMLNARYSILEAEQHRWIPVASERGKKWLEVARARWRFVRNWRIHIPYRA